MTRYAVRTAPRPAGDGWAEAPSVTYGGAPSFWHRRTADTLEWYAYDRAIRGWRYTVEALRPVRGLAPCPDCGTTALHRSDSLCPVVAPMAL